MSEHGGWCDQNSVFVVCHEIHNNGDLINSVFTGVLYSMSSPNQHSPNVTVSPCCRGFDSTPKWELNLVP